MSLPGRELTTSEDDAGFVSGPANDGGLRVRYFDDGRKTRAEVTVADRYASLPGRIADGIVFALLDDCLARAADARFRTRHVGDPDASFHGGPLAPGRPILVEAFPGRQAGGWTWFVARAVQDGEERAHIERRVRAWNADEAQAALDDPHTLRGIREDARAFLAQ